MSSAAFISPPNLSLTQGRDESFLITLSRADVDLDEGALAGVVFCIKRLHGQADAEAPVRLTLGAGLARLADADPSTLKLRVDLPRTATTALSPLITYFWDVAVLDGDGRLRPVEGLAGRVEIGPRIAHSAT